MIKNCILAFALAVFIGGLTYGLNVYFKSEKMHACKKSDTHLGSY